jgi:hypothetical protein
VVKAQKINLDPVFLVESKKDLFLALALFKFGKRPSIRQILQRA